MDFFPSFFRERNLMDLDKPLRRTIENERLSAAERRQRCDRRNVNLGPPANTPERRQSPERRAISVSEISLSDRQWEFYFPQVTVRWHVASA
jgi:hypothetical protein